MLDVEHHTLLQVAFPGLFVFFEDPFRMLGLAAVAITFFVTLTALSYTPHSNFSCNKERYDIAYRVFKKISVAFCIYVVRPALTSCTRQSPLHLMRPSVSLPAPSPGG